MTQQIATTPEQGKRLLACGVDPSTADMFYTNYRIKPNDKMPIVKTAPLGIRKDLIPAWSLSTLLALLPNKILVNDVWYECQLCKCPFGYEVRYHSDVFEDPFGCLCNNPIEGCVEAIKWLTSNGYDLNKD